MDLDFTPDQEALRDSAHAVLAKECPIDAVRDAIEARWEDPAAPAAIVATLWPTLVELGWPGLTVPEEFGGVGLGPVEMAIVAEELGRVMAPGPLLPTLTQFVPVVVECGDRAQQEQWLGAIANGESTGALAVAEEHGSFDPSHTGTVIERDGDRIRLVGAKRAVMEATTVDTYAVVARETGTTGTDGLVVVLVPRTDASSVTPIRALDRSRPYARVEFAEVAVTPDAIFTVGGHAGLIRALEAATVAVAAEMVGTAQTIFDIVLEYAKARHQFGVPIGSFQSMKHKFADLYLVLERARATVYFAALTMAQEDDRRALAVAMAKTAAGDAKAALAKQGIQILGGIGMTWEHDMQMYVRRLHSDEAMFGTATVQRSRVADLLGV